MPVPTQGNGYGQQGYNQRRGRFNKEKGTDSREMMGDTETKLSLDSKICSTPTNVPVPPTYTWNSIESTFPTKPELFSNTTECPIPSEPDVPSTNPTATSDSHAATNEHPVCPTSRTTNEAAGAYPKSQYISSSQWIKVL